MTIDCRLYLITPASLPDLAVFGATLEAALSAGDVAALQLRLKGVSDAEIGEAVRALMPIAHRHDVAFILNDRPDLAKTYDCDGVHIGLEDASLAEARRMLGPNAMIGVTCADSRHRAMDAAEDGADYVAFGAFYPTRTHDTPFRPEPEILTIWHETMLVPSVAIGGIKVDNAAPLVAAGADFIAVVTGVWDHPAGPAQAVIDFNAEIAKGLAQRLTLP